MIGNYHLNNYYSNPLEFDEVYLIQIGRLYCKATTVIDTHIHTDLFEITVVTDGMGTVTTNGVASAVKSGDVYLSMPGDIHKIESDCNRPLKYDFFAFKIKENEYKSQLYSIAENYHAPNARIFTDENLRRLIANALGELSAPYMYSNQLLNSMFRQILVYLIRDFQSRELKNYPENATQADIICLRLMNYIDTHIYTLKTLSELCAVTDYSYGYLSSLFKKTTGETIYDYYNKKRNDAAKLLLRENKLTVTEISETLGYSSLYAFSKAFKNQFGLSPKIYRKQLAY